MKKPGKKRRKSVAPDAEPDFAAAPKAKKSKS
jgi:hypothetical protein